MDKVIITKDYGLLDLYLSKIESQSGLKRYFINELNIPSSSLFSLNRLYVFVDNPPCEELFNYEEVIQVLPMLDKRTSFYKKHKDQILTLEATEYELINYCKNNSNLTYKQARELILKSKSNLSIIQYELKKQFFDPTDYTENELFKTVDDIFYGRRFTLKSEVPIFSLLVNLSNTCRDVYLLQAGYMIDSKGIYFLKQKMGVRSNKWLKNTVLLCLDIDSKIKSNILPVEYALPYLLLKIKEFENAII